MPKPSNPGAPLAVCDTCNNPLPPNYEYTVCVACRAKCSNANGGAGNHEYVASFNDGCVCRLCNIPIGEAFRAFTGTQAAEAAAENANINSPIT